ncbi:MAG: DNA-directed RNA polymerase subunit beta', partial [Patescibacteria group bacterium]
GDAMGVFLPLSTQSIDEVKSRMLPYHNLLKPADGTPIVLPNKEMALGIYYLTTLDHDQEDIKDTELKVFSSGDEAISSYHLNAIALRQPVIVNINGKAVRTSVGRIIVNEGLPEELRFINNDLKAADVKNIVVRAIKLFDDNQKVGEVIDRLKEIGFWGASISGGLSLSIFDCKIIAEKAGIINEAEKKIDKLEKSFNQGLLTIEEKKRYSNKLWIETTETLADKTWASLDNENPVKLIIKSGGARASREQLKQLSAMKGLVVDPLGKIIEVPTKSNYREGLSIFEYVISARGARKGLTDSALKTADAGYLTRRLVDVSHDVIIREEDCQTTNGLIIHSDDSERGEKFFERIRGRFILDDIKNEKGSLLLAKGELITEEVLKELEKEKIAQVIVRSALYCKSKYGTCQQC